MPGPWPGDIGTTYTSIDFSSTGTTTILDPNDDQIIFAIRMAATNISTGDSRLETTDGSSTAILDDPGAGNPISLINTWVIPNSDTLQINVEATENSTQTAVVSHTRQT